MVKYLSMTKVAMIGAGEIGRAIGKILASAGHKVTYWDKNESLIFDMGEKCLSLPETLVEAETVFFCVPSWSLGEALAFTAPYFKKGTVAVSVTKGIGENNKLLVDEALKKALPTGAPTVDHGADELGSRAGLAGAAAGIQRPEHRQVHRRHGQNASLLAPCPGGVHRPSGLSQITLT